MQALLGKGATSQHTAAVYHDMVRRVHGENGMLWLHAMVQML